MIHGLGTSLGTTQINNPPPPPVPPPERKSGKVNDQAHQLAKEVHLDQTLQLAKAVHQVHGRKILDNQLTTILHGRITRVFNGAMDVHGVFLTQNIYGVGSQKIRAELIVLIISYMFLSLLTCYC